MELFKNTDFDFLGKKWPFIGLSLVLTVAGLISLATKGGPKYGIDFNGGTLMYVKFAERPPLDKIRAALTAKIPGNNEVQDIRGSQEVLISTEAKGDERQIGATRQIMVDVLNATFGQPASGKLDLNGTGQQSLADRLQIPLQRTGVSLSEQQLTDVTKAILNFRDTPPRSGLIRGFDELSGVPGVTPAIIATLKQECYLAPFTIRSTSVVGPKVGGELRGQAIRATLYALAGMLVYVAIRFEWIYGLAAVIAVFHDTIITLGLFSLFNKEIDLTVVAALLTLVGYSMNDTIVVFDRIRENLKILRRERLEGLINRSVNQTLSRTILTSGLTLLTAMSLFIFGGQVLNGFAFALVVGIIVGTYSSIFVASPILVFWQNFVEGRKKKVAPAAVPVQRERARSGAKVK